MLDFKEYVNMLTHLFFVLQIQIMLPSTEITSNIIVAHSLTRSSAMSMENLSRVLNAASEEQQAKLRDERNPIPICRCT